MNLRTAIAIGLVAALVAGPIGVVSAVHEPGPWSGVTGITEPDTQWDTPTRMFHAPNHEAVERIYLNGFLMQDNPGAASMPGPALDVNLEGGSLVSPVATQFVAILGFWRDCNGDGFIGMRGAAATYGSFSVYPAAAADIDTDVCPPGSPYWPTNQYTGQANGYVDEFRNIGPLAGITGDPRPTCIPPNQNPPTNTGLCVAASTTTFEDKFDVSDHDVKVWADWGFPGSRHVPTRGLIGAQPGTYDDSDGSLRYVDDTVQGELSNALGGFWTSKPNIGECTDNTVFLGGPNGQCGVWPLFQVERIISDQDPEDRNDEPTPFVTAFETHTDDDGSGSPCDDGFDQTTPAVGSIESRRVAFADVDGTVNPNLLMEGSLQGQLTNFMQATNDGSFNGQCGQETFPLGSPESSTFETEYTHRAIDQTFRFQAEQRLRTLASFGFDWAPPDFVGIGVKSGAAAAFLDFGGWFGGNGWTMLPPRSGYGSVSNAYTTFYADVSSETFTNNTLASTLTALPAGGQDAHTYGTDYCPSFTAANVTNVNPANDWECDIKVWEDKRQRDYQSIGSPEVLERPILGDKYDVRDTDCMDNSVSTYNGYTQNALDGVRLGIADCGVTPPQ